MADYTIKDLERLSGIKAHTIRIWEKRYKLIEPERTSTNIRTYCDAELKKLLNISVLNKNGIKISKIAGLSSLEISDSINKLSENSTNAESQIENLAIAMINLDETRFEKILSRAMIQFGFEDTVIKIINPFFLRIGIMWQTGSVNPAQEHFVSNLVRQKILVAIDSLVADYSPSSKTFILFLPEKEQHELGLLFSSYLIRKWGHKVIYLGQNVPFNDLVEIEKIRNCDCILTSFITSINDCNLTNYILELTKVFSSKKIYFSGKQASSFTNDLPTNAKYLESHCDLISELNKISSL